MEQQDDLNEYKLLEFPFKNYFTLSTKVDHANTS